MLQLFFVYQPSAAVAVVRLCLLPVIIYIFLLCCSAALLDGAFCNSCFASPAQTAALRPRRKPATVALTANPPPRRRTAGLCSLHTRAHAQMPVLVLVLVLVLVGFFTSPVVLQVRVCTLAGGGVMSGWRIAAL